MFAILYPAINTPSISVAANFDGSVAECIGIHYDVWKSAPDPFRSTNTGQ